MMYVGFVIPIEESLRLLKLPDDFVKTFYSTEPVQAYLKDKGSKIIFQYIDKGACLFGIPVELRDEPSVEDTILAMIHSKRIFLWEIKTLRIDVSKVNINRIEEDTWTVENPEPYVIIC
jgi:hypothetical protein